MKRSRINPKVIDCFRCGEIGHKISDCKTSIGGGKGASDQVGGQAETYAGVVGDKHKIGRGDSDMKRTEDLLTDEYRPGTHTGRVGEARHSLEVTLELREDR